MYCKRCGKKLDTQDRFCSFCGSPVEKKDSLEHNMSDFDITEETEFTYKQVNAMQRNHFDEEWEREERREKFTFMIFGVMIVVLIAAITGGVVFLFQKEGEQQSMNDFQISQDLERENADNFGNSGSSAGAEVVITPELIIPNETLNREDSEKKENLTNDNETKTEFVIYDSDVRYLVTADLNKLTPWQIRVARNEIFARHGRMFDTPELRTYFENKSWYVPTIPAVEFNNSCLSEIEMENLNFIINYEKAHNLN